MKADAWFRAYTRVIDNPKLQTMDPELFRQLFNYWCLAKLNEGVLPPAAEIAWRLRRPIELVEKEIKSLIASPLSLLEKNGRVISPTEWEDWQTRKPTSTERVKRHRDGKKSGDETPNETLDETLDETPIETRNGTPNGTQRRGEERNSLSPPTPPAKSPNPKTAFAELSRELCEQLPNGGDPGFTATALQAEFQKSERFAGKPLEFVDFVKVRLDLWRSAYAANSKLKPKLAQYWLSDGLYSLGPPTAGRRNGGRSAVPVCATCGGSGTVCDCNSPDATLAQIDAATKPCPTCAKGPKCP